MQCLCCCRVKMGNSSPRALWERCLFCFFIIFVCVCLVPASSAGAQREVQDWCQTRSLWDRGGRDKHKSRTINTPNSSHCKRHRFPPRETQWTSNEKQVERSCPGCGIKALKPLRNERCSEVSQPCLLFTKDIYF